MSFELKKELMEQNNSDKILKGNYDNLFLVSGRNFLRAI